jgi:hypothetical protein
MREYLRSEDYVYRKVIDEHLLISLRANRQAPMWAFTPSAAAIWEQLQTWCSADTIVAHLTDRFEVSADEAGRDVTHFLEQLESIGALDARETTR